MRYLLDISILLALMDPAHVSHAPAHAWFAKNRTHGWASCPLTQNGAVRIAAQPAYLNSPGAPAVVAGALARFVADPHHEFWPDDISLLDPKVLDIRQVTRPNHVTDIYLLALAVHHRGALATMDARLRPNAIVNGAAGLALIPGK